MSKTQSEQEARSHHSGCGITAPALLGFPELRHISTTRNFSPPGTPRLEELKNVRLLLDSPSSYLACAGQRHTANAGVVTRALLDRSASDGIISFPDTDAIICPIKNVTVTIQTADCAPIFLYDPARQVIALVHAGWKGTHARIATKTVRAMQKMSSDPSNLIAWIGPGAANCCYEVSDELVEKFVNEFNEMPPQLIHQGRHLDLISINSRQLQQAGLSAPNIHTSNICTIHQHDSYYSYRADSGTTGRIISAMVMLEKS